jgi:hypothetical protein
VQIVGGMRRQPWRAKMQKKNQGRLKMQILTARILEEFEPFDKIRTALYLHNLTSHHQNKDIEWHSSCNPHSEITLAHKEGITYNRDVLISSD